MHKCRSSTSQKLILVPRNSLLPYVVPRLSFIEFEGDFAKYSTEDLMKMIQNIKQEHYENRISSGHDKVPG